MHSLQYRIKISLSDIVETHNINLYKLFVFFWEHLILFLALLAHQDAILSFKES